jgi:hypothetical protein
MGAARVLQKIEKQNDSEEIQMKDPSHPRKGQATCVKRGAVLDVWSRNPWGNGTQIDELEEMQRIHVRTVHSLYEITVIDGHSGEILVKGGECIPDLTEGRLTGATLGGSFCKMRGIYPGFKMEFVANGQRLVTSTVQTVSVFRPESLQDYSSDSRTAT